MKIKWDMIGLFVKDLPRMVDFYKNVIGLEFEGEVEGPYAEFRHEGIRFSFFQRKELPKIIEKELTFPPGLNGTFELALNVKEPQEVDKTFQRMVHAGAQVIYEPRDEPWKLRSAMIADPEGNLIELASDFWE